MKNRVGDGETRSSRAAVVRVELGAEHVFQLRIVDLSRARRFYRAVFGIALSRGRCSACAPRLIDVVDLDEAVARTEANGGRVVIPRMSTLDVGWVAFCQDPDGNVLCLRQKRALASARRRRG